MMPLSVWDRLGVVLAPTTVAENGNVFEPTVIYEASPQLLAGGGSCFKMWYSSEWNSPALNYAESRDGVTWTKYASNPIISGHCRSYVVRVGSTYYLYAANTAATQIDLYTSSDGVAWTLDTSAAVALGAGGAWDNRVIANLVVWNEGGSAWKMLYEAAGTTGPFKIGYATSTDGKAWTKSGSNPVIAETGSRGGPGIFKSGSTYWLWVHGSPTDMLPTDFHRYTSTNLTSWSASPSGIIFSRKVADEGLDLDVGQVADPAYVQVNGSVYLFFSASRDGTIEGAGQRIKCAIAVGKTFADLVATNEEAP